MFSKESESFEEFGPAGNILGWTLSLLRFGINRKKLTSINRKFDQLLLLGCSLFILLAILSNTSCTLATLFWRVEGIWLLLWLIIAIYLIAFLGVRYKFLHNDPSFLKFGDKGVECRLLNPLSGISQLIIWTQNGHQITLDRVQSILPRRQTHILMLTKLNGHRILPIWRAVHFKEFVN